MEIEASSTHEAVSQRTTENLTQSIVGGAAAGVVVDTILFPLDTLKTRLQSQYGFWNSGGFKSIYKGFAPAILASPFSAAAFFATYNGMKDLITPHCSQELLPFVHSTSASFAEVSCCCIKVPAEIVKQRRQALLNAKSPLAIMKDTIRQEGMRGIYRGYFSTLFRDIPFSIIQFPVWEYSMKRWKIFKGRPINSAEVAACGAFSGAVASAITTPLDVAKTQIMLAEAGSKKALNTNIITVLIDIKKEHGFKKLFAGFLPRIFSIMLGGGIFFGVYDKTLRIIGFER
ncbi:unnamed protein product [Bemisia tabaci]|uniref:S-adenosylmethionine mitochondrial carrier protein n=1 Tax=Bemisia tabaci TaxID=7038 RepID=A0A9P0AI31_BEMTA|nr:unnamed protein product [Bemisia tabaci]